MTEAEETPIERNLGPQPLDTIMIQAGLGNHDIVLASKEPLTHKTVQRARKGRRLTSHMQRRIAEALHQAILKQPDSSEAPQLRVKDLFTY